MRLNSADQVVFVLQLAVVLGPLAVYFLCLGLVNSQSRPCVVRARADFAVLTIVVVPVVVAPLVALLEHGLVWVAAGGLLAGVVLFVVLLPGRDSGWVVYNSDIAQCRRIVARSCRRLGWRFEPAGDGLRIPQANLTVVLTELSWLRNVSMHFRPLQQGGSCRAGQDRLIAAVGREVRREEMLPSATGASLVVIGAALLAVPMWYLFHHMDALVNVVWRMLLA